ncbi:glycosyltransferase family 9 protein [Aeromonas hydrophila]|uniref:glycosyltransferase family 9 protein n=1 Tax=Aeromonas hydrophila TaxID=644 RepID=UPI00398947AD
MNTCLVVLKCSKYDPLIVEQLFKSWPEEWLYWIVPDGNKDYIEQYSNYIFSSAFSILTLGELENNLSSIPEGCSYVMVYSDDGAIVLPQQREIDQVISSRYSISVFHLGSLRYDKRELYSPSEYDTPDNYLCGALISRDIVESFSDVIVTFNNRWLAHALCLKAIDLNIDFYVMRQFYSAFPNPSQISGAYVSLSRKLSIRLLQYFSSTLNSLFKNPVFLLDMMTSCADGEFSLDDKHIIDHYLSSLTNIILSRGVFSQLLPQPVVRDLKNKDVVIFKVECIGDVITTMPFYEAILNSDARNVYLITTESMRSIFEKDSRYADIIYLPTSHKRTRFSNEHMEVLVRDLAFVKEKLPPCDIALFPRYCIDTSICRFLSILLNIKVRIGFQSEPFAHKFNLLYDQMLTDSLAPPYEVHETERMLWFVEQLGLKSPERLNIPHLIKAACNRKSQFVIGLGAASLDRRWPKEYYVELINKLATYYPNHSFILLGGEDVSEDAKYVEAHTVSINSVGALSLFMSAEVISCSELYIGNDSGLMHISAVVDTPVVEISKHPAAGYIWHANSPKRFGPWGVKFISVQPTVGLNDCIDACIASDVHCISQVKVDAVLRACISIYSSIVGNNK